MPDTQTQGGPMRRLFRGIGSAIDAIRLIAGRILFVLLLVFITLLLFGGGEVVQVPDGGALVLTPTGSVVEQATPLDPLQRLFSDRSDMALETELRGLLEAIERAAGDERIKLLVLDLDRMFGIDPAKLATLSAALANFKETSGKPVVAMGDNYGQAQYYLASHADEVYLHPMGGVLPTGYAIYPLYLKEALDKLGVTMNVFRVGTYKAAVEPFIRNDMSEASRDANRSMLEVLWSHYVDTVSANRSLAPGDLDAYINGYDALLARHQGDSARLALEEGLVDELLTRDEARARLIERIGRQPDTPTFRQIDHRRYLAATNLQIPVGGAEDKVAVVVAKGTILPGEHPPGTIGGTTVAELVRQAREDDRVKAVVIRIDSPGGSAFASEVIRRELELTQTAGKPVVASFGGMAASGGYWIASTADRIVANASTITGSIGVFATLPTFEGTAEKLGLHSDGVGTTQLAGALDPVRGIAEPLQHILQRGVEHTYGTFLGLVSRGRNMLPEDVDVIAQGRPWAGAQALELGLVDEIGGIEVALASAAELAGLEEWEEVYVEQQLSPRDQLIKQLLNNSAASLGAALDLPAVFTPPPGSLAARLGSRGQQLADLARLADPRGHYALCDSCRVGP